MPSTGALTKHQSAYGSESTCCSRGWNTHRPVGIATVEAGFPLQASAGSAEKQDLDLRSAVIHQTFVARRREGQKTPPFHCHQKTPLSHVRHLTPLCFRPDTPTLFHLVELEGRYTGLASACQGLESFSVRVRSDLRTSGFRVVLYDLLHLDPPRSRRLFLISLRSLSVDYGNTRGQDGADISGVLHNRFILCGNVSLIYNSNVSATIEK